MSKRYVLSTIIVILLSVSASIKPIKTHAENGVVTGSNPVPNRYIVMLATSASQSFASVGDVNSEAEYLSGVYGGEVKMTWAAAIKGYVVEMSAEQAEALSADSAVQIVEQDRYMDVASTQSNAPWALDRIDQHSRPRDTTYGYFNDGTGVHAYILDTGIRATHVEFGGRANAVYDNIGDGQNGNDCNGHGTHVAGIIGSATYGVAKNILLHAVRVVPCNSGNAQIANLIDGINWVSANHVNPAVANISLTAAGSSPSLETALTNAIASGVTFAVAAGNAHFDACNFTPARTPNAITVGATADGPLVGETDRDIFWNLSNFGPCIDLAAPGNLIDSTWNTSDTAINTQGGTSMSSPMVAGVAALYLQNNQTASPATVTDAILTASTVGALTMLDPNQSLPAGTPNKLLYSWVIPTTAANATVSGRVTSSVGAGLNGVRLTLSDDHGVVGSILTNTFGYYTLSNVPTGRTYVLVPSKKATTFTPTNRVINLLDDYPNADFVGS